VDLVIPSVLVSPQILSCFEVSIFQNGETLLTLSISDGVINLQIAQTLTKGTGKFHGVDSSEDMINSAKKAASSDTAASKVCTFEGSRPKHFHNTSILTIRKSPMPQN
jgi:hypothetical protein